MKKIHHLLSVATIAAVMASCSGSDKSAQQGDAAQQVPEVETMAVGLSSSEVYNTFPTTIEGSNDADIRPQVSGTITKVHVDEGQEVKAGQVLFTIDQVQFKAAVDAAKATVNSAQTAVNTARITAEKDKALLEKGIISNYAYELSNNQLLTAQANLASAKAQLTNAQKNLAYTVVTAPANGVVGSIPFREGSLVSPSMQVPLTTISNNGDVYAIFSINEKALLDLTDNGERSIEAAIKDMPKVKLEMVNGKDYAYDGEVVTISGVIDKSTGTSKARALFPNPNGVLRSGSTGRIRIPVVNEEALVIPQSATYRIQDKIFVLVVDKDNAVHATPITIQPKNDSMNYVVTSGLTPGDVIVTQGVNQSVRDGMTIKPVAAKQQEQ